MYRYLNLVAIFTFLLSSSWAHTDGFQYQRKAFVKLNFEYHNETMGLVWAYECKICIPKRFLFDGRTHVEYGDIQPGISDLERFDGKAGAVVWLVNTTRAVRILPASY